MKRPRLAVLALAVAAASTGAMAASGDTWYGTNRYDDVVIATPVEVTRVYAEPALSDRVIYEERIVSPVFVEREYVVYDGPEYVVISREDPAFDPLNPQLGAASGAGFQSEGP